MYVHFQRAVQLNEQRRRSTGYALLSNSDLIEHVEDAEAIETHSPNENTKEVDYAILDTPSKPSVSSTTVKYPQKTTTQSEKETSETSTENSLKEPPQGKQEDDGASHSIAGHQQLTDVTPDVVPTENSAISVEKGLQEESSMEVSSILSKLVDEVISHKITGHLYSPNADVIPEITSTENGAISAMESSMENGSHGESLIDISLLSNLVDEVISYNIIGNLGEPFTDVIPEIAPTENGVNSAMASSVEKGSHEESFIDISLLSKLVNEVISYNIIGHFGEPLTDVMPEIAPTENGVNSAMESSVEKGFHENSLIEISRILSKLVDEVISYNIIGHLGEPFTDVMPEIAPTENGANSAMESSVEKGFHENSLIEISRILSKLVDEVISYNIIGHLCEPLTEVTPEITPTENGANSAMESSNEEGLHEESSIEISRILSKLVDELTSNNTTGKLDEPLVVLKPETSRSENGTACEKVHATEESSLEELPVEIYNIHTKMDDEDSISLHTIECLDETLSYVQMTTDDHNVNGDQRKSILSLSWETLDTDAASTDGHQTYRTRKPGLFRRFYKMISRLSCLPRRKSKKNLE